MLAGPPDIVALGWSAFAGVLGREPGPTAVADRVNRRTALRDQVARKVEDHRQARVSFTELSTWAHDMHDDPAARADEDVYLVLIEITASADDAAWRTSPVHGLVDDGLLG